MSRSNMTKLCVFCKHFCFDLGAPHYSEMTPGYESVIECSLGCWEMDNYEGVDVYRKNIIKAESCEKYERVEDK